MADPDDTTIASYDASVASYIAASPTPSPHVIELLDRIAELSPGGHVLEIGCGPGREAAYLEGKGLRVDRTDATPAFVALHESARLLDVRTDDLGGPYDVVLANAVLIHLSRAQCADVLARARDAVRPGGLLAVTLKEGDGEAWSTEKLDLPRHFTYWREDETREALVRAGWTVLRCDRVQGRLDQPWLFALCRAGLLRRRGA